MTENANCRGRYQAAQRPEFMSARHEPAHDGKHRRRISAALPMCEEKTPFSARNNSHGGASL